MSYKALVRSLDGKIAVFGAFTGDGRVEVLVGDEFRILEEAEWQALPAHDPVRASSRRG